MSPSRARGLLLALAVIVVLAAAGFVARGYFRQRALRTDLPARLGLDIQQDSTGFTVSKSENGHTIFTLHAARAVQFRAGGDAKLKDVRITLYGPPGSQRQDRIEGAEFAFNQATGIASADGDVEIDLQGLTYSSSKNAVDVTANPERGTVHLRTSGLTFSQKTGIAETSRHIEFRLPQAQGSATGARYDSASGVLVLQSDVVLHTSVHGDVNTVTASHAVLSRADRHITMERATVQATSRTLSADHAELTLNANGDLDGATASGSVTASTDSGGQASAPHAVARAADNQLRAITLDGGVKFSQAKVASGDIANGAAPSFNGAGSSESAELIFSPSGNALDAMHLRGAVHLEGAAATGGDRRLLAGAVDAVFRERRLREIHATGSPSYSETGTTAKGRTQETLSADSLVAEMNAAGQLDSVDGRAHAHVVSDAADGSVSDSRSEHLHATFAGADRNRQLSSVTQQGDVHLRQQPAKAGEAVQSATGGRAVYDAAADTVVLTDAPRWSDGTAALSATSIVVHRGAQTAEAQGQVKCTYAQAGAVDATHIVADGAVFRGADHSAVFRGGARLWQASNAVAAPYLKLSGQSHELIANSEGESLVRATFLSQPAPASADASRSAKPTTPDVVSVTGTQLVYSDAARVAHFTGGVTMRGRDATVHSQTLDAYLAPAAGKQAVSSPVMMAGKLERAVARGTVMLQEPGRSGYGDELAYSAADGKFVLTGSEARAPRLDDAVKGSVTGAAIVFGSRDDSVRVEGGGKRTVTTTYTGK